MFFFFLAQDQVFLYHFKNDVFFLKIHLNCLVTGMSLTHSTISLSMGGTGGGIVGSQGTRAENAALPLEAPCGTAVMAICF